MCKMPTALRAGFGLVAIVVVLAQILDATGLTSDAIQSESEFVSRREARALLQTESGDYAPFDYDTVGLLAPSPPAPVSSSSPPSNPPPPPSPPAPSPQAPAPPAKALGSVNVRNSVFTGLNATHVGSYSRFSMNPLDVSTCAGNGYIVQVVTGAIAVYSASTGELLGSNGTAQLFNPITAPSSEITGARCFFDGTYFYVVGFASRSNGQNSLNIAISSNTIGDLSSWTIATDTSAFTGTSGCPTSIAISSCAKPPTVNAAFDGPYMYLSFDMYAAAFDPLYYRETRTTLKHTTLMRYDTRVLLATATRTAGTLTRRTSLLLEVPATGSCNASSGHLPLKIQGTDGVILVQQDDCSSNTINLISLRANASSNGTNTTSLSVTPLAAVRTTSRAATGAVELTAFGWSLPGVNVSTKLRQVAYTGGIIHTVQEHVLSDSTGPVTSVRWLAINASALQGSNVTPVETFISSARNSSQFAPGTNIRAPAIAADSSGHAVISYTIVAFTKYPSFGISSVGADGKLSHQVIAGGVSKPSLPWATATTAWNAHASAAYDVATDSFWASGVYTTNATSSKVANIATAIVGLSAQDPTKSYAPPSPSPAPATARVPALDVPSAGPYKVGFLEYKFPAVLDPVANPAAKTELWGSVWYPSDASRTLQLPVVVVVHGNHGTCEGPYNNRTNSWPTSSTYSWSGVCTSATAPHLLANHAGYDYFTRTLASYGVVVLSINTNRGITSQTGIYEDSGLIAGKARVTLRHIQLLSYANRGLPPPEFLGVKSYGYGGPQYAYGGPFSTASDATFFFQAWVKGRLDLSRVGLIGHSRGGDSVRGSVDLYRNDPYMYPGTWSDAIGAEVNFAGVLDIAGVDYGTGTPVVLSTGNRWWPKEIPNRRFFTAWGVPQATLIPNCDGDVNDQQSIRAVTRMIDQQQQLPYSADGLNTAFRAYFRVWGTNHNNYNTHWNNSDSVGCYGEGAEPVGWTATNSSSAAAREGGAEMAVPPIHTSQSIGAYFFLSFFRGTLFKDPAYLRAFDPLAKLPERIANITTIERTLYNSVVPSQLTVLEQFERRTGISAGGLNISAQNTDVYVHAPTREDPQQAAQVMWGTSSTAGTPSLTVPLGRSNSSRTRDLFGYDHLIIRAGRPQPLRTIGLALGATMMKVKVAFSIQLLGSNGRPLGKAVNSLDYWPSSQGPVGLVELSSNGKYRQPNDVTTGLKVPLLDLGLVRASNLSSVTAIKFTFTSGNGTLMFVDISASKVAEVQLQYGADQQAPPVALRRSLLSTSASGGGNDSVHGSADGDSAPLANPGGQSLQLEYDWPTFDRSAFKHLSIVDPFEGKRMYHPYPAYGVLRSLEVQGSEVTLELESKLVPFEIRGSMTVACIGAHSYEQTAHPGGDHSLLRVRVPLEEARVWSVNDPIAVQYGSCQGGGPEYLFGKVDALMVADIAGAAARK